MRNIGLLKSLTQPVAGVALLVNVTMAIPSASLAQKASAQKQPVYSITQTVTRINSTYTLGGGDRIRINVFEVPEYSGEYQIPPGGAVNLPLVGSVSVLGLTTEQSADLIARKYGRYLKRPIISVNLLSPRPINIFVAGEITRPGSYSLSLQGGAGNDPGVQYPTVLSALTTAQGVTQSADITKVELRRKSGRGPEQVEVLNLDELRRTGRVSQDLTLRDGDTIYVPMAATLDIANARNLAATSFAADPTKPRTVTVIGEVIRPGSYLISPGSTETSASTSSSGTGAPSITGQPTITRALQTAGGITAQADVRNVVVRRPTRTGGQQTIKLNLWQLLGSGDSNQDIILQDGDTIFFPTATEISSAEATQLANTTLSPTVIHVNVVGEVKKPGVTDVQPNSSLNQALLAAGGFNDARASRAKIDLIRLNPDGSVTKRQVKVDLASGINEQTNPILRNNDVLLISRNGITKSAEAANNLLSPLGTVLGIFRAFFGF
ncbi:MAG: SLBB domain-containing protein [Rhizonema sp. PD37]|nr:SLBB domain-containing protein [Rhizonema sp. PD37]